MAITSTQNHDTAVTQLLRRIAVAPNREEVLKNFRGFQSLFPNGFPFEQIRMSEQLYRHFSLARGRLRRIEDVPESLQSAMQRIQTTLQRGLLINPVLACHLNTIGDGFFENSSIDNYISAVRLTMKTLTFPDLFVLLGSDWGSNNDDSIEGSLSPLHTLQTFYYLMCIAADFRLTQSAQLWERSGLLEQMTKLERRLKWIEDRELPPPNLKVLSKLRTSGKTLYLPVGYAKSTVFYLSLIAIDYVGTGYRLRLLTADGKEILPAGDELDYYCPEVVWEGLQIEQLTDPSLWKPLLEVSTLTEREILRIDDGRDDLLAFDCTHLVPWLIRRLGKRPRMASLQIEEHHWAIVYENQYRQVSKTVDSVKGLSDADENQREVVLRPTEKQIKSGICDYSLRKFVNLLPLDIFRTDNEMLVFKAESRLLMLVSAYTTLQTGKSTPSLRGNLLRLLEESYGKITAPIEKLLRNNPTEEQQEISRTFLVSLLDLKQRVASFARTMDRIPLATSKPLYPSTHTVHHLELSAVHWRPIEQTLLDFLRLDEGILPLPYTKQWTADRVPGLYALLAGWYDVLLDANHKCEPVELITLAHRNIFSKLPIPSTDNVEETFPDEIEEGLQLAVLLMLKKISSLVASEVYTEPMVPPLFVADMARVYRFCIELYRKINPEVRRMPVSWFCLHQYLVSRHSFHMPENVKTTLLELASSFNAISPKGHLRPSDEYKEIPLFYLSWETLPLTYRFHRESLGPLLPEKRSVEEVLMCAELADNVGLKPEEAAANCGKGATEERWRNSFGGQCVLILEQIAQYHTMSVFITPVAFRKKHQGMDFMRSLGPEDHFQLLPVGASSVLVYTNGNVGYSKGIGLGEPPFSQRMVLLNDAKIRGPIHDLPVPLVGEWREQADLLKALPKQGALRGTYTLHQAASGPSILSLDVLLEYFEARPALLLGLDYRSYFWGIVRSAHVMETALKNEPVLIDRLRNFIHSLYLEDRRNLHESNLNFERSLWLLALTRHLCRFGPLESEKFQPLLLEIMRELRGFCRGKPEEVRLAPHLLACQQLLPVGAMLPLSEIAHLHLLVGRAPPGDPNEMLIWLEACDAMQTMAPHILNAMAYGELSLRRELWGLVLSSKAEIEEVINRKTAPMRIAQLGKKVAEMERQRLKHDHLERWVGFFKNYSFLNTPWRNAATVNVLTKVREFLDVGITGVHRKTTSLIHRAGELLFVTPTSMLVQISGRIVTVDWDTGRVVGGNSNLPAERNLPVFLRKHPDFAPLGQMLRRPLVGSPQSGRVHLQGNSSLTIDIGKGAAWLTFEGAEYRLVSRHQQLSIQHPDSLREGFTIWLDESGEAEPHGLVAAHTEEGEPQPAFSIDRLGVIHPLKENAHLSLAGAGYYPEAQLFERWGIEQGNILVWLDEHAHVAELHLPLHSGERSFTRVIRTDEGRWLLDGLDVHLVPIAESIPAFAGHPVYFVAENRVGQRILLLPGATPYEIQKRQRKKNHVVMWNQLLTSEGKECIHQYRVMPTGQVEGLTVADNLLLMLWTLYMGHYSATTELVHRWLTPPGRPYSDHEQRILLNWIRSNAEKPLMKNEEHPSALSLRLFVIVRMARHLRDFPPIAREGKTDCKLWKSLVSKIHKDIYYPRSDISSLFHRGVLGSQMRTTGFEELFSEYDHEAALRLIDKNESFPPIDVERSLYNRLNKNREDLTQNSTKLTCKLSGRETQDYNKEKYGHYYFVNLCKNYPATAQTDQVPVETLYRTVVPVKLAPFFDRAYTLIKEGNEQDVEYAAIVHALEKLRKGYHIDLCTQYKMLETGYSYDVIFRENLLLWLILEQAYLAKNEGHILPELPSLQRRFGLALESSKGLTKNFFTCILNIKGVSAGKLLELYLVEWFQKTEMRVLTQSRVTAELPKSFYTDLKTPWSKQLTNEIERWKHISSPLCPREQPPTDDTHWSYPTPVEWADTPPTEMGLLSLQFHLLERIGIVSAEKGRREKRVVDLANVLPVNPLEALQEFARQIHYVTPRSVDECIGLALINNADNWKSSCPMSSPEELHQATVSYLEVALDEAHLRRINHALRLCLDDLTDTDRLQQLMETLRSQPRYLPGGTTLPMMVAEYYSDCRLRTEPDQANLIQILTRESELNKGSVIQAIMGSGKSKMIAPVWLQMMLGTGRIPILCVPSELFLTTVSDLQNMMWNRFRTHVRAFTFEREKCTPDLLYAIAETLYIARLEPTVFVTTTRDLHALQLMLKERHQVIEEMRERLKRFTLKWSKSALSPVQHREFKQALLNNGWSAASEKLTGEEYNAFDRWFVSHEKLEEELQPIRVEADLLQAILNLLQNESALLVDEVATSYDPRNLLSFPIGWQTAANPCAVSMGCKIYFEWLPEFYNELGLLHNMQSLSDADTRKRIFNALAKKGWHEYRSLVDMSNFPSLRRLKAYMFSNSKHGKVMQGFVNMLNCSKSMLMRQYAQELAFLKYALTTGLEGALTSTGDVNYGRSKQNLDLYLTIPYQCANVPKENTLFRRPWKTILMTCQDYSQGWKDARQTGELIGFLQGIDPSSKDRSLLQAASHIWGRSFSDVEHSDKVRMKQLAEELNHARVDPEKEAAARLLIHTYLNSCVFPAQLKLDPSQFTSTPQAIPMLAAKADAMGGTFGFETTWNPNLKRVPDHSSDAQILKALAEERNQHCHHLSRGGAEALLNAFESGMIASYMALIDAGALFKGLSNTAVASRLLQALTEFDCIVFYDEEQQGGARLAVMSRAGKTLLEHSDKEGVRRALSQLKLSAPFTYYDQARRIGADLELPPGRALLTFSNVVTQDDLMQSGMRCRYLLDGRHSVGYAIPGEMGTGWTGDRVIIVSKQQQRHVEKKANFHGICEQLRGEVRTVIDRTMRSIADPVERHKLHKAATEFLMERQENDLVKTFGSLHGLIRSEKALNNLRHSLVKQIVQIVPSAEVVVRKRLKDILKWHKTRSTDIPERVRMGDEHEEGVQEVDLSKDQDKMRLMEEEYERMLGTRQPKKEAAWTLLAPQMLNAVPLGSVNASDEMPTLYRLEDALSERGFTTYFSPELLISANVLSTFLGEANCLLTENQKPVHRGLFIRGRGERKPKLILVSEGDSRYLKEHLLKLEGSQGHGIYLIEPSGAINQRGDTEEAIFNLWREGTPGERKLLVEALLFQGSALLLNQIPREEISAIFDLIVRGSSRRTAAIRILFEAALEFRPDDMLLYRRSQSLRALFV